MRSAVVWVLVGLVLAAAGEGEKKKPVERDGIRVWAFTPFQDVVNAIAMYRAAKIEPLTFVGAPPPGKK
ncbi:MAG: hypothetical protein ABFS86_09185 [Planctomycetota bacterium]